MLAAVPTEIPPRWHLGEWKRRGGQGATTHRHPGPSHDGGMPFLVMQIVSTASGGPTPFDGQYVVEYDPTRPGVSPATVHLVCNPDIEKARRFPDVAAVHAYWCQTSGRPYPADRPLTAYTVHIHRVPDDRAAPDTASPPCTRT